MPKDPLNRALPPLKAALTRAKNSKDPRRVIDAVARARDVFELVGYPDNWAHWESLADSARMELTYRR